MWATLARMRGFGRFSLLWAIGNDQITKNLSRLGLFAYPSMFYSMCLVLHK